MPAAFRRRAGRLARARPFPLVGAPHAAGSRRQHPAGGVLPPTEQAADALGGARARP